MLSHFDFFDIFDGLGKSEDGYFDLCFGEFLEGQSLKTVVLSRSRDSRISDGLPQGFIRQGESDAAAEAVLEKYRVFLESQDYAVVQQGDREVVIAEKGDFVLAFACRSYFGGVLSVKSQKQGQAVIEKLIGNLPK